MGKGEGGEYRVGKIHEGWLYTTAVWKPSFKERAIGIFPHLGRIWGEVHGGGGGGGCIFANRL
jgi:hypothetical protein